MSKIKQMWQSPTATGRWKTIMQGSFLFFLAKGLLWTLLAVIALPEF